MITVHVIVDKVHDQYKITERIKEFYTELYDSGQSTTIHTDTKEVPEITSWETEAALRDMKNGTATANDHTNMYALVCVGMYKYGCIY